MVPVTVGVNVTFSVHALFAGMLAPQGVAPPAVTAKSPLPEKPETLRAALELFVTVSVCAGLVVPTVCPVNVRLAGVIATGTTAVPVIFKIC